MEKANVVQRRLQEDDDSGVRVPWLFWMLQSDGSASQRTTRTITLGAEADSGGLRLPAGAVDVERHELLLYTYAEDDAALGGYTPDMRYVRELFSSKASTLSNGVIHIFEDHRGRPPVAAKALRSWSRMGFQKKGAAVPFKALDGGLHDLFENGQLYEVTAVLLQLDGWLREQDWGLLWKTDVAVGPDGGVRLTMGRRERGGKVKTGASQGVVVAWQVTEVNLRASCKGAVPLDPLFPISQDKYRKAWRMAFDRAGLEDFGPLHSLRRAGAAAYIVAGGSLEAARQKGRWQTTSALQRYTKLHVLIVQRSGLTSEQLERGRAFLQRSAQKVVVGFPPMESMVLLAAALDWRGSPVVRMRIVTGATLLSVVGQAASQAVATTTNLVEDAVALRWEPETRSVAIVLPLGLVVKIAMACLVAVWFTAWIAARCCCRGDVKKPEEHSTVSASKAEPQAPKRKAPPRVFCEAGVQGPVHYNGTRYLHATQGFKRADEVTRVVASSGYRVPPGWEGTARPDPRLLDREHQD